MSSKTKIYSKRCSRASWKTGGDNFDIQKTIILCDIPAKPSNLMWDGWVLISALNDCFGGVNTQNGVYMAELYIL